MESLKPQIYFSWMFSNLDPKLKISDSGNALTCQSSIGPFKNAYGNFPLLPNGIYYWELQIRKGAHFKIGIVDLTKLKPDAKGAFSDFDSGFAYYSMGELRNKSNLKGVLYGGGYGIGDTIGILFDRCKGTLSFFNNGTNLGVAFHIKDKESIFYPAVGMLMKEETVCLKLPSRED